MLKVSNSFMHTRWTHRLQEITKIRFLHGSECLKFDLIQMKSPLWFQDKWSDSEARGKPAWQLTSDITDGLREADISSPQENFTLLFVMAQRIKVALPFSQYVLTPVWNGFVNRMLPDVKRGAASRVKVYFRFTKQKTRGGGDKTLSLLWFPPGRNGCSAAVMRRTVMQQQEYYW